MNSNADGIDAAGSGYPLSMDRIPVDAKVTVWAQASDGAAAARARTRELVASMRLKRPQMKNIAAAGEWFANCMQGSLGKINTAGTT